MKLLCITAIAVGTLVLSAACQTSPASNSGQDPNISALSGTDLVAELSKSVSVKNAKPGDLVKAVVTQDVLAHGKIVIRRGSKLLGHVIEAKARSTEDQESRLGMVFDKAVLKGGGEIDFSAAVRALAPAIRAGAADKPDQMMPPMFGPRDLQFGAPQPITGSSAAAGRGTFAGSSMNPAVTSRDTTNGNAASRIGIYSAATSPGGNPESDLMGAGSRGVFRMPDLKLSRQPGAGRGSVVTSTRRDVKLDSGTQMVIQINNLTR